jgi:hypothetical protein
MLLTYFLNDFEIVPFVSIIIGIAFVFTFQRCIPIVRSVYFNIFSAAFFITFLSLEVAASITTRFLFVVTDYDAGLLPGVVLSVCTF